MNSPLRFRPYLRPMVWGGRALGDVLGKSLPTADSYGEAWEISDHASHQSALWSHGPRATLRDLMRHESAALVGRQAEAFPWLVKFLDAADWLSVQVHPDDEAARQLWPGEGGKTEAWFILSAKPDSKVYAGLKPGVDERVLRRALEHKTVADCLHSFTPRAGDCLYLPAGTVHAVGGGVLMAEVQQTSDATFRLYDWDRRDSQGRGRQLHVEQSVACIDWHAGPVTPVRAEGFPERGESAGWSVRQTLVECPFFQLDYLRQAEPFALPRGGLKVVIVLHGRGAMWTARGLEPLAAGDTLLLPAALAEVWCQPDGGALGLLLASLPEVGQNAARRAG